MILIDLPVWVHSWLAADRLIKWHTGQLENAPGGHRDPPPTKAFWRNLGTKESPLQSNNWHRIPFMVANQSTATRRSTRFSSTGSNQITMNYHSPGRTHQATEGEDAGFTITPEPEGISGEIQGDTGTGIGNISLGRGSNHGIRGIYRRAADRPIPIIASKTFLDQTGVGIRRPFMIDIQGGLVPVEVIETIKYFPTLDPERAPFAVVDIYAVIDFIELRGRRNVIPNELFVSLDESDLSTDEISEEVRDVFRLAKIDSRAEQIQSTFVDPIAVTG